jgi:hypothetical protein
VCRSIWKIEGIEEGSIGEERLRFPTLELDIRPGDIDGIGASGNLAHG